MGDLIHMDRLEIDIYPVGALSNLLSYVHEPTRARVRLSRDLKRVVGLVRQRRWRTLRNYFNGYLAEPRIWPVGVTRCGRGWTRGRAYRCLEKRIREAGHTVVS